MAVRLIWGLLIGFWLLVSGFVEAVEEEGAGMGTNRLSGALSPYLQQHADNPVQWYPWGEEAFAKAQREQKPIFLSIGYSTCHWCHVMNRESFQDEAIAALLNEYFVPIKVDREERPDVDRVYMTFVTASTGSGGWPLSVWLTPDLKPFTGGTYYPPDDRWGRPGFKSLLQQISQAWEKDRSGILTAGEQVVSQLRQAAEKAYHEAVGVGDDLLQRMYRNLGAGFDARHGGFSPAPKFPRPSAASFMLRYHARTGVEEAREMVLFTLRKMAEGGLYDQVGGGFHRYAVDTRWQVPHFEKMLYDQALLVPLYLEAYQLSGESLFARIAREVLTYVARDLTGPEGQFFSAEDADSPVPERPDEHREGAFYVWQAEEMSAVLGTDDAEWVMAYYGVEADGNVYDDPHDTFTGQNILHVVQPLEAVVAQHGGTVAEWEEKLHAAREHLRAQRETRPRPHRDDKAITGWNGLMISAYARAYKVLGDPEYLASARQAAGFVREYLYDADRKRLLRLHRAGETSGEGFLEDYAFLIQALLDLYEATFDTGYLAWALELQDGQDARFLDTRAGGYFDTTDSDPSILIRMKDDHDGAVPAGNSVSAMNLLRLSELMDRATFREQAERTILAFSRSLEHVPHAMPQMMAAVDLLLGSPLQILIAGEPGAPDTEALLSVVHRYYLPNRILMLNTCSGGGDPVAFLPFLGSLKSMEGQATAYVCQEYTCERPVHTPEGLDEMLGAHASWNKQRTP